MSDREEDRSDVDELFGDLDDFFAPIDEVDWPEGEESEEPAEVEGEAAPEPEEEWAPEIEVPDEGEAPAAAEADDDDEEPDIGDLFGEEPEPAREDPEAPREEPEAPREEPEPARGLAPEDEEDSDLFGPAQDETGLFSGPAAPDAPAPAPERAGEQEATAEMSGEEWARLRSELGTDEEEEEAAPAVEVEPPAPDLSIDDLREGTPPQYADLPASDEGEVFGDEPTMEDEPAIEDEDVFAPPVAEQEAEPEEIEAAAAHFASGLDAEQVERELLSDLEEGEAPVDETLGGAPTWQEPAAYGTEEAPPPSPPTGGRNLPAAVASGAILAVAAIALLAVGKGPFVVLAIALITLGQGELYAVLKQRGFQPATALGLIAGVLTMAGAYLKGSTGQGEAALLFGLVLGAMLTVPWYMAAPPQARTGAVRNAAATVFGIVYVPLLASFALLILATPGDTGRNVMLTVIGLTVLYDICAYAIGTLWGNRPLAPTVSPRKSWEGAIGATFVLLLVALAIVPSIDPFTASNSIGLALVIAIAAPLGDLVESAIKRDLGVKDMGSLLPGHGGILDRIDAILFTAPAAYYYLALIF